MTWTGIMTTEKAILAGGCFWGMQDLIRKRPGVISTRVGYTGGDVPNATYRNHGGHAEAIEIVFDPDKISYRDLLEFFFQIHDPTTLNRQGNDIGTSYRSAIFYLSDEQKRVAEDTIADVDASGLWPGKVVTEVDAGRAVLGGRARAPGLPGALPERVHLPLRPPGLEAAAPRLRRAGRW
jgi:peptide-methionine (S)-S-oxide reductase